MDAEEVRLTGRNGVIVVTASKGEWQEVIDWLISYMEPRDNAPAELVHWLINQGVYDD